MLVPILLALVMLWGISDIIVGICYILLGLTMLGKVRESANERATRRYFKSIGIELE
jgi:hypothetical protein